MCLKTSRIQLKLQFVVVPLSGGRCNILHMFDTSQEDVDDVVNKPLAGELQVISLNELCFKRENEQDDGPQHP